MRQQASFPRDLSSAQERTTNTDTNSQQACLALLSDLEKSLGSSQTALHSRDLARLEQLTAEQGELLRALSAVFHRNDLGSSVLSGILCVEQAKEIHEALARVLHLGRVQSALLKRAQQRLRTISNVLAGPHTTYGPAVNSHEIIVKDQQASSKETQIHV